MKTVKELREERQALIEKADAVLAGVDGRMGGEDSAKFDAIHADIESLNGEISRVERQEALRKERAGSERSEDPAGESRAEAFRTWCRAGQRRGPSAAQVESAARLGFDPRSNEVELNWGETRALATVTSNKGQTLVPEGFVPRLEVALKAYGGVREVARVLPTATGNPLPFPTTNDTANKGRLVAENAATTATDVTFSSITLGSFKFDSDIVLVSNELLQDESVDLEGFLAEALGERIARILNEKYTTGAGTTEPKGVVVCSTLGKTAAGAAAITYDDLVDLMHSVDPAYQSNSRWMFNFTTLGALKKLKDAENRPLWSAGMAYGEPATILGRPYTINQDMANIATTNKTVLYGDFSKYLIREVSGLTLLRLNERYADNHQVGFLAALRADANLLNAGTNPVKHLAQA